MSQQDAISLADWQTAKYSQPSLRVAGITVDALPNAAASFPVILSMRQGMVATVTRTPVGGATITQNCLVQRIGHQIGPSGWKWSAQLSPYTLEASILQLDNSGFDQIGNGALG